MRGCRTVRSRRRARTARRSSRLPAFLHAFDLRAESTEAFVDALIAALDLPDIIDGALTLGAERGEKNRHAGANVGALDLRSAQSRRTHDNRAVRIAEDD